MAALNRPGSIESDEHIKAIWNDDNRRLSLQIQNMTLRRYHKESRKALFEQADHIDDLQERIRDLERLVIQSQTREESTLKQTKVAVEGIIPLMHSAGAKPHYTKTRKVCKCETIHQLSIPTSILCAPRNQLSEACHDWQRLQRT